MKQFFLGSIAFGALVAAGTAFAADMPVKAPPPPPLVWNWTGGYIGGELGGAWGITKFSDPSGPSIYGDNVRTPAALFGADIGFNWQAPSSPWVFGVEAEVSGLASWPGGTNTCFAFSGLFVSANCRVRPEIVPTFTGRVGFATGPQGRTLLYVKGGLAGVDDHIDIATNAILPPMTTSATVWKWGGTVGGGIEEALTPAWSLKLEYDYLGFGGNSMPTPGSFTQVALGGGYVPVAGNTTRITQNLQEFKLGLNYRLGADPKAAWPVSNSVFPVKAPVFKAPPAPVAWSGGWEFEGGARYWYSNGRFQKDLGTGTSPSTANVLNSRLTYVTDTNSGEVFARVDTPWNLFLKGFAGGGWNFRGHMNDEDWILFGGAVAYSNTLSNPVTGAMRYATIDGGFDFLRGPDYKVGGFVGYNTYRDNKSAFGCAQIANPISDCVPALPNSTLVITENDTWNSLRVGLNGETMIFPGVKISGDAAYVPYTRFTGVDNHVLRSLISPESGNGQGVQLEAILSYYVTPAFSLGVGGRYWAMWTNDSAITNFGGAPCPCQTLPSKTERAGTFLQASYKFGVPTAVAARD
jgi:opacity protein-like surface antigen